MNNSKLTILSCFFLLIGINAFSQSERLGNRFTEAGIGFSFCPPKTFEKKETPDLNNPMFVNMNIMSAISYSSQQYEGSLSEYVALKLLPLVERFSLTEISSLSKQYFIQIKISEVNA